MGFTQGTSKQNLKQIRAAVREKSKNQKSLRRRRRRRQRRQQRRRTQGDFYSHTHSLSVTNKMNTYNIKRLCSCFWSFWCSRLNHYAFFIFFRTSSFPTFWKVKFFTFSSHITYMRFIWHPNIQRNDNNYK